MPRRNQQRQKYKRNSYQIGEAVEFIGKDKKNRGMGIIMCECNIHGLTYNEAIKDGAIESEIFDTYFDHCKVFWQVSQTLETCHKSYLKRIPDFNKGLIRGKNV